MSAPSTPKIAHPKGFYYEVKAGQRYLWCSCGRSGKQPFCDGSHVGTTFKPVLFEAKIDEDVIFCGCKQTGTAPFCDGAHNNLPGGYSEDDPESPANRAIAVVPHGADARVPLDGACYVFSTKRAKLTRQGDLQLRVGAAIRSLMGIGSHPERVRVSLGELRHIAGFD